MGVDLTEQLINDAKRSTVNTIKGLAKAYDVASKGIALILDSSVFSEAAIMKALDRKLDKTGDLQYSSSLVSMEELQTGGKIEKIDEPLLKDSMKFFDKYCREFGVKYSALKVEPNAASKIDKGYYIFFEGKNDKVIDHILKNSFKDWQNSATSAKHGAANLAKPSVLSKLAFFLEKAKEASDQVGKALEGDQKQNKNNDLER